MVSIQKDNLLRKPFYMWFSTYLLTFIIRSCAPYICHHADEIKTATGSSTFPIISRLLW